MSADTEVRVTSETGGQKGAKPQRYDLIPTLPLRLLAEQYGKGAEKYERVNGKDNWRNGYDWSLSYAAIQRHLNQFWAGEDLDEETGAPHPIAAAWHCFALVTFMFDDKLRAKYDDRQDGPEEPGLASLLDMQAQINRARGAIRAEYGTFKPWVFPSTEEPDPIGCIVTVTGDEGETGHHFLAGMEVEIQTDDDYILDGSHLCQPSSGGDYAQWVSAVDLA